MEVHGPPRGTLGVKARARLQQSEYYDDLMLLSELDRRGRVRGAAVCELEEALEFLRELASKIWSVRQFADTASARPRSRKLVAAVVRAWCGGGDGTAGVGSAFALGGAVDHDWSSNGPRPAGSSTSRPPAASTSSRPTTSSGPIVAPLDQDVGADRVDQRERGVVVEDRHGVDGLERAETSARRLGRVERAGRPFEAADARVGVEADDEEVAQRGGLRGAAGRGRRGAGRSSRW